MKKGLVLALAVVMLLSVAAVASAVTIPNAKDLEIPEIPQLPVMQTKNNGTTQTVTFSEPVDWMAAVYCDGKEWTWNDVTWASQDHLEATVDMTAHKMSPGYGFWSSANYDADGNCTWSGAGFYEMDYAYDVILPDGTDVKFSNAGEPRELTLRLAGTEYFGSGKSVDTNVLMKYRPNAAGKVVPYVHEIKESYRNGSTIVGHFSMNGTPYSVVQTAPDGTKTILFGRSAAAAPADDTPAEPTEGGEVLFEGEATGAFPSWESWQDNNVALDLKQYAAKLNALAEGQSIAVTYTSANNPPLLLIQPQNGDKAWSWNQIEAPDSNTTTDAGKVATYSYNTIVNAIGTPNAELTYSYFALYGYGEDATVTKVEILPAE